MSEKFLDILKYSTVKTVVNTHTHSDHTGSNHAFSFIFAHTKGFERLKKPKAEMMIQKIFYGVPKPCNPREVPNRISTGDYTLKVLYTPGHSSDHISLYEPNKKWAFTGDLLLWGPTREVFTDVKIYDAIESLHRLSKLKIEILFPGHGPPFTNPNEALRDQIDRLETLKLQIRNLNEKGLNAKKIRNEIFGKERILTYLSGGKFSALNLVNSYLEKDGKKV